MRGSWFFLLIASICLEGLGRRYIPAIPSIAFYLFKDAVLLLGYALFRPTPTVNRVLQYLYRGFGVFWLAGFLWTLIEVANPSHQSLPLALLGLRAYWLWWLAPAVIAVALQDQGLKERALYVFAYMAIGISILAAIQFSSSSDSSVNIYSVVDGAELHASEVATVATTGRARVASTFAFLSGFCDFTILVPALLLSLGLETKKRRLRLTALIATLFSAAVLPMSGSRASVILGLLVLVLTCWSAGLFFTAVGRRAMLGALVGGILATVAFPDALIGVTDRFNASEEETNGRLAAVATVLPPVALLTYDYPGGGIGTGMQQNARFAFGVRDGEWNSEAENHRYLVELGPIGFCLIWMAKLGLLVALMRAYQILKRAGRNAGAGAALAYAAVTLLGNVTFDHIWQALYFVGCGFILAETISALQYLKTMEAAPVSGNAPDERRPVSAAAG
jgi:hypothetical protein